MPRKKKIEQDIEPKEIETTPKEVESKPKKVEDNRTLAQKLANYKRKLRRI